MLDGVHENVPRLCPFCHIIAHNALLQRLELPLFEKLRQPFPVIAVVL